MKLIVYLLVFIITITSCNNKKSGVIGKIGDEIIYASDVDKLAQQELFDQLNQIYNIKSKAFDAYVDLKLLNNEAKMHNITINEFANSYVSQQIKMFGIDSLYQKYQVKHRVKLHGTDLTTTEKGSLDDSIRVAYSLKAIIIQNFLDSLKETIKIEKYVYPPKSPNIKLDNLLAYYRGNLNSKVTFYTISDFDCSKCIEYHSLYDSIYMKYKDKIRFGYINFSSTPTLAQLACDAADKQGRFWEYHDSLYQQKYFIDSVTVFNIAKQMNLDMKKFEKDLLDKNVADKLSATIDILVEKGIYATPTIVVNNRLIYNSASYEEISYLIEKELKQ